MKNILKCEDGVYRWAYELNMYKNPTILLTVLKIVTFSFLGVWILTCLLSMGDHNFWWDGFLKTDKVFAILIAVFWVIGLLAYLIVAAAYGGKYCVLFEMDEDGIRHTQMAKQVKKAEVLSLITALAGAAAKNSTAVGSGLLAGSKTSIFTDFKKVKHMKLFPRRQTIKLSAPFSHNQIYAEPEDFEFVLDFISQRIPDSVRKA